MFIRYWPFARYCAGSSVYGNVKWKSYFFFRKGLFLSNLWLLPSLPFLHAHIHIHIFTLSIWKSSRYPALWQAGIYWTMAYVKVGGSSLPENGKGAPPCRFCLGLASSCEWCTNESGLHKRPSWFFLVTIFNAGQEEEVRSHQHCGIEVLSKKTRKTHVVYGLIQVISGLLIEVRACWE